MDVKTPQILKNIFVYTYTLLVKCMKFSQIKNFILDNYTSLSLKLTLN